MALLPIDGCLRASALAKTDVNWLPPYEYEISISTDCLATSLVIAEERDQDNLTLLEEIRTLGKKYALFLSPGYGDIAGDLKVLNFIRENSGIEFAAYVSGCLRIMVPVSGAIIACSVIGIPKQYMCSDRD